MDWVAWEDGVKLTLTKIRAEASATEEPDALCCEPVYVVNPV